VSKKPYEPKPGEYVQLSRPPYTNFDICCGCGLVHRFDFKLLATTKGRPGITIWRRMYIDERRTAQARRTKAKHKELYTTSDGWYVAAFPINARKMRKRKKRK
jgi:hypothetical protein